jgi:histidinol-phosphate/aromatic aminotransferase/cobyric acid decarboxylase-like protein
VPAGDRDALARAAAALPNLKLVFVETPANPTLRMTDLAHAVDVASAHPAKPIVAVDNTFLGRPSSTRSRSAPTSPSTRRPSSWAARATSSAASCSRPTTS